MDLKEIGSIASLGRLGILLLRWYPQARKAKRDTTIQDYLEWLRRQNHSELLAEINASTETLNSVTALIAQMHGGSLESIQKIAAELPGMEKRLSGKLDSLADVLGDIQTQVRLFEGAAPDSKEAQQFETAYLEQVAHEFGRMQMLGVREMRDIKQSLSIAYVSLRLKTQGSEDDEPLRAEDLLMTTPLLAVRGPAGSGKSTLLSWMALQCAITGGNGNAWAGGIPFFIPLRRLEAKEDGQPDLRRLVSYTIDPRLWAAEPPTNWCDTVLHRQRGVVLIDGVDELPAELRPNFWKWLDEFVARYPGNRVYVTSRYFPEPNQVALGKLWAPPKGFTSADLDEMNDADVREFIKNWHNAVIAHEQDLGERAKIEDARDKLPQKLREPANTRVRDLCRSPLLCALVCALHWREEGYLPSKRVELYDRCCTMLIEERDAKRNIQKPRGALQFLDLSGKEMILQRLAWSMMRNKSDHSGKAHQIEVTRADAVGWIKPNIAALDSEEARKASAEDILNYLMERTGLLREPTVGFVDYPHRTFQEYLAACAAGALNEAGDLARRASDDQWHETIILAAGTKVGGVPFGNSLVRELVELGEKEPFKARTRHSFFALAVACLETGRQVTEELRNRVLGHVKEVVPPSDFYDARVLSAAGDAVVPLLKYSAWGNRSVGVVSACARTLALIGSQAARASLLGQRGYASDRRANVLAQICGLPDVNPLDLSRVAVLVQISGGALPEMLKPFISDLSPISKWTSAEAVGLGGCSNVRDLSPLAGLTKLKSLTIEKTGVTDLAPVSALVGLTQLELRGCPGITSVAPLAGLAQLVRLSFGPCGENIDASSISNLTSLASLQVLQWRAPASLSPLSKLTKLKLLALHGGPGVNDISGLATLTALETLLLINFGAVTNFSPLASLTNLARLDLDNSPGLTDLGFLASLPKLLRLDLRGCKGVIDAKPIAEIKQLQTLYVNGTKIQDFSPLIGCGIKAIFVDWDQLRMMPPELKPVTQQAW